MRNIFWFPVILITFCACMCIGAIIVIFKKIGKAIRENDERIYEEFTRLDDEPFGDTETITELNHNLRNGKS